MKLTEHKYTPGQVAELTGLSVDTLRDWRRRDILKDFGQMQATGRWLYSGEEILTFAIARALEMNGQSILYALWMAHHCLIPVVSKIRPDDDYKDFAKNYVLFWLSTAGSPWIRTQGWDLQFLPTNDLSDIQKAKAPSVFVVDIEHLALSLKSVLANAIRYGIAEPGKDGIHVPGEPE